MRKDTHKMWRNVEQIEADVGKVEVTLAGQTKHIEVPVSSTALYICVCSYQIRKM